MTSSRASLFALVVLFGCHEHGDPTGSTCPPDSTLTYETFGQDFMEQYCTSCHAKDLQGSERNGATEDHDFETLARIRAVGAEHIDVCAAAGPKATNTIMPPEGEPQPTEAERKQLGEWLACRMP